MIGIPKSGYYKCPRCAQFIYSSHDSHGCVIHHTYGFNMHNDRYWKLNDGGIVIHCPKCDFVDFEEKFEQIYDYKREDLAFSKMQKGEKFSRMANKLETWGKLKEATELQLGAVWFTQRESANYVPETKKLLKLIVDSLGKEKYEPLKQAEYLNLGINLCHQLDDSKSLEKLDLIGKKLGFIEE